MLRLLKKKKGRKEWLLVHSDAYDVHWTPRLQHLMESVQQSTHEVINVVILQTRRADGTTFPHLTELQAGKVDPQLTLFVRTRFATAHMEQLLAARRAAAEKAFKFTALEPVVDATLKILAATDANVKINEEAIDAGPKRAGLTRGATARDEL